jgi:hypothetical protein
MEHKQHLTKRVLTCLSKKGVLNGSSKKGSLNSILATISLSAFTFASLSSEAFALPEIGYKKIFYTPKIENVKQAKKAYIRSKTYQAQLNARWDQINTWAKLRFAVKFTPWCRVDKPKSKTGHLNILHYDSHGKVRKTYGMHIKTKMMKQDRLFKRSKSKLKVCAAPYDVGVLRKDLHFNEGGQHVTITWIDIL